MTIRILDESTINKIAAGEVIERPASVVKELLENAIDAKADKIDIILEQAGKNLIIISDNGVGISETELEIAVLRHTTSKLDEEDLLNIHTFGFRGEALPSIAAISKMRITSKISDVPRAFELSLIGGKEKSIKATVHNNGTKVEIRDLFFATPARLKFLRTDKTEFYACLDVVKKIAMAHHNVSFSLLHDNKIILNLRKTQNVEERIADILGQEFIDNSVYVELTRSEVIITGYTSIPTFNRATSEDQFLFVNNRPVKDKILNVALRVAYQDYLARDRYPISALFLSINPQLVDVNVHPAKSEVRFYDANLIRGLFISAIKDALATGSQKTSTTISTKALEMFNIQALRSDDIAVSQFKHLTKLSGSNKLIQKYNSIRPVQTTFVSNTSQTITPSYSKLNLEYQTESVEIRNELSASNLNQALQESSDAVCDYVLGDAKAQVYETYIIAQTRDSIIIVDQHAAHERLSYEKIKQYMDKNGLIKQRLLIPEIVELPDGHRAQLLSDHVKELSTLGLSLEKFGEKSIIVYEMPNLLGDVNVQKLIRDLADNLLEHEGALSLVKLIEKITETYACHYSIRAGRTLTIQEMNVLLRQMEQTPFSGQCNHGRPTYIELKLKDIEKLFSR